MVLTVLCLNCVTSILENLNSKSIFQFSNEEIHIYAKFIVGEKINSPLSRCESILLE